jgi:hypothetical protein
MHFSRTSASIFVVKGDKRPMLLEGSLLSLLLSRCSEMRVLSALPQLQQIQQTEFI